MTVYDVVQTSGPESVGSQQPGRYLVQTSDWQALAEKLAHRCNEARFYLPGNRYTVEERDEEQEFK